jgi:hypothetical protein
MKQSASRPSMPSQETAKGVKSRRCARQSSRYFVFFRCSCERRTASGFRDRYDGWLTSVTTQSTKQSMFGDQHPQTSRSACLLSSDGAHTASSFSSPSPSNAFRRRGGSGAGLGSFAPASASPAPAALACCLFLLRLCPRDSFSTTETAGTARPFGFPFCAGAGAVWLLQPPVAQLY